MLHAILKTNYDRKSLRRFLLEILSNRSILRWHWRALFPSFSLSQYIKMLSLSEDNFLWVLPPIFNLIFRFTCYEQDYETVMMAANFPLRWLLGFITRQPLNRFMFWDLTCCVFVTIEEILKANMLEICHDANWHEALKDCF